MNRNEFYELVAKSLVSETTQAEQELLQRYCQDESYNKLHKRLKCFWEAELPSLRHAYDHETGIRRLREKIKQSRNKVRKKRWIRIKVLLSAIILIPHYFIRRLCWKIKKDEGWWEASDQFEKDG